MIIKPFYKISPDKWLLTNNSDVAAAQTKAIANPEMDETHIEEYVRQWVLKELIDTYSYPADWFGERIIVEERVQMATMLKEADILRIPMMSTSDSDPCRPAIPIHVVH